MDTKKILNFLSVGLWKKERVTVHQILSRLHRSDVPSPQTRGLFNKKIEMAFNKIDDHTKDALQGITIRELAQKTELDFWH